MGVFPLSPGYLLDWKGNPSCDTYMCNVEDDIHIFVQWAFAKSVWDLIYSSLGIRVLSYIIYDLTNKYTRSRFNEQKQWVSTTIYSTLWLLYFGHCQRIFNDTLISPYSLFKMITKFVQEQLSLAKWKLRSNSMTYSSNYFSTIIYSDGSFSNDQSLAGVGWTISNKSFNLIACGAPMSYKPKF